MVCEAESTGAARTSAVRGSYPFCQRCRIYPVPPGTCFCLRCPCGSPLRLFPSSSLQDCVHTRRTTHARPSSWQCLCGVGLDGCTHVWLCAERSSHTALP